MHNQILGDRDGRTQSHLSILRLVAQIFFVRQSLTLRLVWLIYQIIVCVAPLMLDKPRCDVPLSTSVLRLAC